MHQLIVLGNGFDLACGLKSKFSDFFESRIKNNQLLNSAHYMSAVKNSRPSTRLAESCGENLFKSDLTLWEAVLLFSKNNLWKDIEGTIRRFLVEGSSETNGTNRLELIIDFLNHSPQSSSSAILSIMNSEDRAVCGFLEVYSNANHKKPPQDVSQLIFLLYDQLHNLEFAFGDYLNTISSNNFSYQSNSEILLRALAEKELSSELKNGLPETSVLDFNYTNPATRYVQEQDIHLVNIHGNTNNPIFGIDGKDLMAKPNLVQFTKTYRLLALNNPDRSKIIHTSTGSSEEPTGLIKFYGHSLGDADYSYFQAIFDGVDLYSSNTRLIFYYNIWLQDDGHECTDELAQQDMFHKVTRLMTEYGETMTNTNHGKNLMHKLLLEGRLTIERYRG